MGISLGARLRRSGSQLGAFLTMAVAVLSILVEYDGWPPSGFLRLATWALTLATVAYLAMALWEFFRPPSEGKLVFRFPRKSGTLHDIGWLEHLLGAIRMDRQTRSRRVDARIEAYMVALLRDCSKARILTRDLSWAESADMELRRLAKAGTLEILCCEASILEQLSEPLTLYQEAGAKIRRTSMKSRLRMTMLEKSGSSALAIGYRQDRTHIILYLRDQQDPAFELASNLFDSIK